MSAARAAHDLRPARVFRDGAWLEGAREIIGEAAVSIVIDGGAEAVMMATPADLEDFAYGFALAEGIAAAPSQLRDLEIIEHPLGVELRLWLHDGARTAHAARRRTRAGPAGCGLCGVESLEDAMRPARQVGGAFTVGAAEIVAAMRTLAEQQRLNRATRAAHAAAFFTPGDGVSLVREDVGRHNALDKLVGALARAGKNASAGVIIMTSRVSVELIQKAAFAGAPVLAAISAPTTLALDTARACGLCVCGIVRDNGLEVFTHAERIS
ncbi:MAG: formate dehydrogenase accessory sulfurtransferase FdhD [Hyphomonadaceae bacterium]